MVSATWDANDNLVELEYDIDTGMFPVVERFHLEMGPVDYTASYDTALGAISLGDGFQRKTPLGFSTMGWVG